MNILMVCHYGMYQNLENSFVHAQAAAYASEGHSVRVIVPVAWGKRSSFNGKRLDSELRWVQADGVEICLLRHLSLSNYGQKYLNTTCAIGALKRQLPKIQKGFQPDVIHAHTLGFDSELGAWLKDKLCVPLVVTCHGSDAAVPLERGMQAELKAWCDRTDCVVAVSSVLAEKIRMCGTTTPVISILNGFRVQNVVLERKDPLTWLSACHLLEQKQVHITLQAFAQVLKKHPGSRLTVVGQGPERGNLENLAQELQIAEAVRFLGQLPNAQVLQEMAQAQYFVMPSVREGFGIVYLEAMASGCITIGTEGEGIADLIVSGENGYLVPAGDAAAIANVVENCICAPKKAEKIAEKGRCDARSLTWEHNAGQYLQLFESYQRTT